MSKTVQIRDLDDAVYQSLSQQAAEDGISVPELLRREATRLASRPSMSQWLRRISQQPLHTGVIDVVAALDEIRGPWPTGSAPEFNARP